MLPLTQQEQRQNYFYSLSSSALFIAVLMVLGVFFRFANLEKKIYWLDEIGTSFRLAGHDGKELTKKFSTFREISVQDIQQYQRIRPERGVLEVIRSLKVVAIFEGSGLSSQHKHAIIYRSRQGLNHRWSVATYPAGRENRRRSRCRSSGCTTRDLFKSFKSFNRVAPFKSFDTRAVSTDSSSTRVYIEPGVPTLVPCC